MSTTKRLLLGIATVWPVFYVFLFMGFVMFSMFALEGGGGGGNDFPISFAIIFPVHMLTILGMFALMGTYLYLAVKNPHLPDNMRIIWVILFVTFGMLAMPAYWWIHVWNGPLTESG